MEKENLIEAIDRILDSNQEISSEVRQVLEQTKKELKKSKSKKQIGKAILPLLKMLHYVKEIIELFTG